MKGNKLIKKTIIFANTLWFLEKFKFDLINHLADYNEIECIYLRNGPNVNLININKLKNKNVILKKIDIYYIILNTFKNVISKLQKRNNSRKINNIIVFTIGPIIISQFLFATYQKSTIIVLEGLGRIFSSRLLFYRVLKRFIQKFYKFYFSKCKYIITLNYQDATYLAEMNIAPVSKLKIIPGTGIDVNELNESFSKITYQPKYIDYISRLIPEKGFYSFIFLREYMIKYQSKAAENNPFRIIAPQSDIDNLSQETKSYLNRIGITLKPYIPKIINIYRETKAIIVPTRYGEGLSRVVLETVYLGIPLLVSRNPGTEQVLPFDYKYFIISRNPSVLGSQLENLLNDNDYIKSVLNTQKIIIDDFYSSKDSTKIFSSYLNLN